MKKPALVKLPFAFSVGERSPGENTPIFFDSTLLLVTNYRPITPNAKGEYSYLYIEDLYNGKEVSCFGAGHTFVSAFVDGSDLNVFALDFTDFGRIMRSNGIDRFVTRDLQTWTKSKVLLPDTGEHLFNTSVCRDDAGYIMAYESDKPVQFCFKFARSNDLPNWEKIPGIVYTGEHHEYSACPLIRYFRPYYYVIYLHAPMKGHNGWISYMARSKNLADWELSPFNPVLEAGTGEGKNNSDVDIIEYKGKTYLYYLTGDQQTWGALRVAMYDGPMKEFYESYFPDKVNFVKASARQ